MATEEDILLPPPPRKAASENSDVEDLLPPPPKKKSPDSSPMVNTIPSSGGGELPSGITKPKAPENLLKIDNAPAVSTEVALPPLPKDLRIGGLTISKKNTLDEYVTGIDKLNKDVDAGEKTKQDLANALKNPTLPEDYKQQVQQKFQEIDAKVNQDQSQADYLKNHIPLSGIEATLGSVQAVSHSLASGAYMIPENLTKLITQPFMEVAGMDDKEQNKAWDSFFNNPINLMPYVLHQVGEGQKKAGKQVQNIIDNSKFSKPVDELWKDGDYAQAFTNMGVKVAAMTPYLAAGTLNPAASFATFYSQAYNDIPENSKMTEQQKHLNATLNSMVMTVGLPVANKVASMPFKSLIEKEGLGVAEKTIASGLTKSLSESLKPYVPLGAPVYGYLNGWAMNTASNIIAKITDPDAKDINLTQGSNEAGLTFAALPVLAGAAARISHGVFGVKARTKVEQAQKNVEAIDKDLKTTENPIVQQSLVNERGKTVSEMNDHLLNDNEIFEGMSPVQQDQIEQHQKIINSVEEQMQKEDLSPVGKKALEETKKQSEQIIEKIYKENDKLIKEAAKSQSKESSSNEETNTSSTGVSDRQSTEAPAKEPVKISEEDKVRTNQEAQGLGFDSAPHAIKAVKKYLNKEYATYDEIPKSELEQTIKIKGGKNATQEGKITEQKVGDDEAFGIKNKSTKDLNAKLGFPDVDLTSGQRRDIKEVLRRAADRPIQGAGSAEHVIERTHADKKPMDAEDQVTVLDYVIRKSNELQAESEKLMAGDESALLSTQILTDQIKIANDALQISGYEQGLAFRIRQVMKKRDYTLAESIRKYSVAAEGEPVPQKIKEKFTEIAKKIEDLTKQNEDLQRRHDEAVAKWTFEKLQQKKIYDKKSLDKDINDLGFITEGSRKGKESLSSEKSKTAIRKAARNFLNINYKNEKFRDFIEIVEKQIGKLTDEEKNIFKEEFEVEQQKSKEKAAPEITSEDGVLNIPHKLIKSIVEEGVTDIDDLTNKIHKIIEEQLPDEEFSHREIKDAITGYGKVTYMSQEEINVRIRELKQQGRDASALEDAIAGEGVKRTGLQRDKPTAEHRAMMRKITEELKKHPSDAADIEKRWKSSLDKIKSNLKNQITDLEKRIDDLKNNRPVDEKNINKKIEYDEEANALRGNRDTLKNILEGIEGKKEMSPEQKVKNAIAAAERSAKDFDRRIKEKDFAVRIIKSLPHVEELTEKLNKIREQRDAKKAEYEELLKQEHPERESEIATQRALDSYEREIHKIVKQINDKTIDYKKKVSKVQETESIKQAREIKRGLGQIIENMRTESGLTEARNIELWKQHNEKAIKDLIAEGLKGFPEKPPKEPKPLNEEQRQILAERQVIMDWRDFIVKQRELKNRSKIEKFIAKAVFFSRDIKLSSVVTVGKLLGFDIHNVLWYKPLRELLPNVIKGGQRNSGSFNSKAVAQAYKVFLDKATLEDMNQARKTGKSQMQLAYGIPESVPHELRSYFGYLHAALKVPSIRAEFLMSAEKRMQAEIAKNGSHVVTDPDTITRVNTEALNDAMSGILLGSNIANEAYASAIRTLMNTKSSTKGATALKKAVGYLMEFQLPIVKVPTNYVKELGAHTPLGLMKAGFDIAVNKGIKNMTPKQIDNVNGLFKSGMIGLGMLTLGYYMRSDLGGYDDSQKDKVGRAGILFFGHKIPHWFLHFPPLEVMQIGATIGHLMDKGDLTKGKKGGLIEGVKQAAGGALKTTPFVGQPVEYIRAAQKQGGWTNLIGSNISGAIMPPDLAKFAQATDTKDGGFDPFGETIYRPAKTFESQFGLKIPYYRKTYPAKDDTKADKLTPDQVKQKTSSPEFKSQVEAAKEKARGMKLYRKK